MRLRKRAGKITTRIMALYLALMIFGVMAKNTMAQESINASQTNKSIVSISSDIEALF